MDGTLREQMAVQGIPCSRKARGHRTVDARAEERPGRSLYFLNQAAVSDMSACYRTIRKGGSICLKFKEK